MVYIYEALALVVRVALMFGACVALIAVVPAIGFGEFVAAGICGVVGILFLAGYIWMDDVASRPDTQW